MKIGKRKIMLLASTLVAAVFAGLLYGYLKSVESTTRPSTVPTTLVVAAKIDIPPRKRLANDMLFLKEVPSGYVSAGEFSSLSDVEGRISRSEILMGEPVRESRLVSRGELASLSLELPPDKRAVTVRVNEIVGVAGFVKPGDRVDVMTTLPVGSRGEYLTSMVAEDVYVVGVSQDLAADEDRAAKLASSVTLAVNPDAAARIVLAEETGIIRLALRPQDGWTVGRSSVSTSDLVGGKYAHLFDEPVDTGGSSVPIVQPEEVRRTPGAPVMTAVGELESSLSGGSHMAYSDPAQFTVVQVIRGTQVTDVVVPKEENR